MLNLNLQMEQVGVYFHKESLLRKISNYCIFAE